MAKSKKRQTKKPSAHTQNPDTQPETQKDQYAWIPLWGWILIFLVPFALSEYMFYVAERRISMALFAVAWVGFWVTIMQRAGWPMIKKRGQRQNDKQKK
jgi:hypothetical protein